MPVPVTITAIERRTDDIRILTLAPQMPFAFHAGQYLEITAPGLEPRHYSIANPPAKDGHIILHVRDMGNGLSHWLGSQAEIGDTAQIDGPYGAMRPEEATGRPVYMIAGGMGVVPMLSIAQDIIRRGITEEGITLIYGTRTDADIYCRRELEALASSGELTVHGSVGAQTPDMTLRHLSPDLQNKVVYISGPDPMLYNIMPVLKQHGLREQRLFTDMDLTILKGNGS